MPQCTKIYKDKLQITQLVNKFVWSEKSIYIFVEIDLDEIQRETIAASDVF